MYVSVRREGGCGCCLINLLLLPLYILFFPFVLLFGLLRGIFFRRRPFPRRRYWRRWRRWQDRYL